MEIAFDIVWVTLVNIFYWRREGAFTELRRLHGSWTSFSPSSVHGNQNIQIFTFSLELHPLFPQPKRSEEKKADEQASTNVGTFELVDGTQVLSSSASPLNFGVLDPSLALRVSSWSRSILCLWRVCDGVTLVLPISCEWAAICSPQTFVIFYESACWCHMLFWSEWVPTTGMGKSTTSTFGKWRGEFLYLVISIDFLSWTFSYFYLFNFWFVYLIFCFSP